MNTICTEALGVAAEGEQRVGGGGEEQIEERATVAAEKRPQRGRQGEDDVEVVGGEQALLASRDPAKLGRPLAGRTVAVEAFARYVGTDCRRWEEHNAMPLRLRVAAPEMRGAARFHQHSGRWVRGYEAGELRTGQTVAFGDAAGTVGDGDFEDRLRDVDGDGGQRLGHASSSFVCRTSWPRGKARATMSACYGRSPSHHICSRRSACRDV